ncbi:hypothetical protein [Nocardia sp. NBC_01377]|uniref:hypothetical protein n=1 Tax=Nocardia sp. NBC_01377 TaxID=2903595 RepID=UPI0038674FFF
MLTADHSVPFVIADSAVIVLLGAASVLPGRRGATSLMTVGFALATGVFVLAFALSMIDGLPNARVAVGFVVTVPALFAAQRLRPRVRRFVPGASSSPV